MGAAGSGLKGLWRVVAGGSTLSNSHLAHCIIARRRDTIGQRGQELVQSELHRSGKWGSFAKPGNDSGSAIDR